MFTAEDRNDEPDEETVSFRYYFTSHFSVVVFRNTEKELYEARIYLLLEITAAN